ncbi:Sel1-like repeat [Methylophilaceae bacterium]
MKKYILLIIVISLFSKMCLAGTIEDAKEALNNKQYSKAFKLYKQEALKGNAEAQHKIGNMYNNGDGRSRDQSEAIKWYKLAADQGYVEAQSSLGFALYNKDFNEALVWFKKAADGGDIHTILFVAAHYSIASNNSEALNWYKMAAANGDVESNYTIGLIYEKGDGVLQDINEAQKWYEFAAENGYIPAIHSLGLAYREKYLKERFVFEENIILAHMFLNICAASSHYTRHFCIIERNTTSKYYMNDEQIKRALEAAKICSSRNYKNCKQIVKAN